MGQVIGKFGVGLKDALATLHRRRIAVTIESRHGLIALTQVAKHGFDEILTLHAEVQPPRDLAFEGTCVRIEGLPDEAMARAKAYFLRFSETGTRRRGAR